MGAITKSALGLLAGIVLAAILIFAVMAYRAMNYGSALDVEPG